MRRWLILSLTLALMTLVLVVGCKTNAPTVSNSPPVTAASPALSSSAAVVKVRAEPAVVHAGAMVNATIMLTIAAGFHVNANPATFSYLIPTEVTGEGSAKINVGKTIYPAAQTRKFQFAEKPLAVYEGETQITLPLQVTAAAGPAAESIPIKVRVQACDNEQCFPPATLNTTLSVEVK